MIMFDKLYSEQSNIILVWPSGRRIPPTTIHVKGYKPGPACVKIFETLMVSASEILWLIALVIPDCLFHIRLSVSTYLVFRSQHLQEPFTLREPY